jgi:hypothetical protein
VQISLEQLIAVIVREVAAELTRRGVVVTGTPAPAVSPARQTLPTPAAASGPSPACPSASADSAVIDMSAYRTPILTEEHLTRLGPSVRNVVVPCSTVLTPGARDLIRVKKLSLVRKAQSH